MKNHMYVIADAMAAALVKQFPAKFSQAVAAQLPG
jgi:hypothetical protein